MKKIFLAAALLASCLVFAADPGVNESVAKKFKEAFPNAQKVNWYDNETYYQVFFTNAQINCRMFYDKEGNVLLAERYYTEDGVCPFIRARLEHKYPGKKVFGVTEVATDAGTTYHIILEDAKRWYHVTADGAGNMYTTKKLIKA